MKLYEVFIYPKSFTLKDAGGRPPAQAFLNAEHLGRYHYWIEGESREEVKAYCMSQVGEDTEVYVGREECY